MRAFKLNKPLHKFISPAFTWARLIHLNDVTSVKTWCRLTMLQTWCHSPRSHLLSAKLPAEYRLFYKHCDPRFQWLLAVSSETSLWLLVALSLFHPPACYTMSHTCHRRIIWWPPHILEEFTTYLILSYITHDVSMMVNIKIRFIWNGGQSTALQGIILSVCNNLSTSNFKVNLWSLAIIIK